MYYLPSHFLMAVGDNRNMDGRILKLVEELSFEKEDKRLNGRQGPRIARQRYILDRGACCPKY